MSEVSDGKERSIEVAAADGGKVKISSKTIGPTALKDLRDAMERLEV